MLTMIKPFITPTSKRLILHSGLAGLIGLLMITWLQIKPLGILVLLITSFWFYKLKFGAEIIPPEDLQIKANAFFQRVKNMREVNPTFFCVVASISLVSLAIVGHILSGSSLVLICLIIFVLLSTKYNFKIVKLKETSFDWPDKLNEHEIDDFLPEVNETNMSVLERASDQSSITFATEDIEEKSEEIPSDLLIADCIPEIDEDSTDEDDALGIGVPANIKERPPTVSEIEFKKGYFKKDSSISTSSSSDEESLSKGLTFPNCTSMEFQSQTHQFAKNTGLLSLINAQTQSMVIPNSILPNIVSGLVSWASMTNNSRISDSIGVAPANGEELSDDEGSDFEIVNTEEYQ